MRETIGVNVGVALGVSEEIDLTVSLFEGLEDTKTFDAAAPRDHLVDAAADRVPESNSGGFEDGDSSSVKV